MSGHDETTSALVDTEVKKAIVRPVTGGEEDFLAERNALHEICLEGSRRPDPTCRSTAYFEGSLADETEKRIQRGHPKGLEFQLKPHQREAIGQLRQFEESPKNGGILADDIPPTSARHMSSFAWIFRNHLVDRH